MSENTPTPGRRVTVVISDFRLIFTLFAVFVSALAIPLASNIYVSAAASAVNAAYLIYASNKKIKAIIPLIALAAIFGVPNGLPFISLSLALVVGTGAFAWLNFAERKTSRWPYYTIVPVFAFALAAIITKSWFVSLLSLIFVIPAHVMKFALVKKDKRLSIICKTSASFVLLVAVGVVASTFYFNGEFRLDILKGWMNDLTELLTKLFTEFELQLADGTVQTLFTPTDAYNMAHQLVTLSPAFVILLFNAVAFCAQKLQYALIQSVGGEVAIIPYNSRPFIVSAGAGIVYVLSYIAMLFANATPFGYALNTVCQNLFVILTPALIGMAVVYFFAGLAERRWKIGRLIIFGVIAGLFFSLSTIFMLITCFGAYASIALPVRSFINERRNS